MKKVLVTLAASMLVASGFAQGTLVFSSSGSLVRLKDGAGVAANGGQVQMAWAPVGTSYIPWTPALTASEWAQANPGWTAIGTPTGLGNPLAGRFSGGTLTISSVTPSGGIIQGVVIGWTGIGAVDFRAGYSNALAQASSPTTGQFGVSNPFTVDTGDPTTIPAGTATFIYNSTATPYNGLTLQAVPEPTSFALAGLGAAALLIFRRRK